MAHTPDTIILTPQGPESKMPPTLEMVFLPIHLSVCVALHLQMHRIPDGPICRALIVRQGLS